MTGYIGTIPLSAPQEMTKFASFLVFVLFSVMRLGESCRTVNKQWCGKDAILQNYTTPTTCFERGTQHVT